MSRDLGKTPAIQRHAGKGAYLKRIKFRYTPKQGNWLNLAECELNCLTSQSMSGRGIDELLKLQTEIAV